MKVYEKKLASFLPDRSNANRGTPRGRKMLGESLQQLGAGRSIVADANDRVPAGNKTLEALVEAGFTDAIVVESDGTKPVVVKRTDWDLTDPTGPARQYAFYDNRVSEVDLAWDREQLQRALDAGSDLSRLWEANELANLLRQEEDVDWGAELGALPDGEKSGVRQMAFVVTDEQAEAIEEALKRCKAGAGEALGEGTGNENWRGNALALICEAFRG